MVKVNVSPADQDATARRSVSTAEVTDSRGRKIAIRKVGPVDRMRLAMILGPDGAQNQVLLGYATLAFAVTALDGEPEHPPATYAQLEALVGRLGDEGLDAVGTAYVDHFGIPGETEEAREALKN